MYKYIPGVSKKVWFTFRGRFEVFRGFKSKKFRRLTPNKISFYTKEHVTSAEVRRAQTKSQQLVVQPCVGAWPCRLSLCELSKRSATQHTTHLPCLHCNLFRSCDKWAWRLCRCPPPHWRCRCTPARWGLACSARPSHFSFQSMSQWGPWLVSSSSPRSGWPETLSLEVSSCFFLRSSISLLQVPRYGQPGLTSWSRWVTGSTPTQGLLYESEDTVSLLSLDPTRSPSQQSSATPTSTTTSSRLLPSTVQVTSRSLPCIPMSVLWYFRTSLY